ncbi:MAG TPA: prepilin-type N-terminal cleavage/methylation domain-containing protein [Candidatus Binatia bacterium]|nr:prepilin-type N-terminal cleavage/methylation domain-containing protein [Candidatus Binatia bacterium]
MKGGGGFTLLEVLVALAILGLAVVAAIQGFAQGLRLLKLAGDHQDATLLADLKAREVVTPEEGRQDGADGGYRWERTIRAVDAPDLAPAGTAPRWRLYEIAVRVAWNGRHVEVTTLRTVPVTATGEPAAPAPPGRAR